MLSTATGPATTGRSAWAVRRSPSVMPTRRPGSGWRPRSTAIKPGVSTDQIARLWPTAQDIGLPDEKTAFGLQFGHGLGLALHERPLISRLSSFDAPLEIREGMVFALETYCPASDGRSAARLEEELVVTDDGAEIITRFPVPGTVRHQPVLIPTTRFHNPNGAARRHGRGNRARPVPEHDQDPPVREARSRPVPAEPGQGHHSPGNRPGGGRGWRSAGDAARRLHVRHLSRAQPRARPRHADDPGHGRAARPGERPHERQGRVHAPARRRPAACSARTRSSAPSW